MTEMYQFNMFRLVQNDSDVLMQGHCVIGTNHLGDQTSKSIRTGTHRFGTSRHPTLTTVESQRLTWNGTWMNFGCVAWTIPAGMTGHGESRNPEKMGCSMKEDRIEYN